MIKKDLREMAGLSTNVIAKMGKGGGCVNRSVAKDMYGFGLQN